MVEKKEKGGREMKRRDLLKAGVAGAATIGLIGLTKKGFAQAPQFKFRLQSFLGPGWKEWEEMLPRYAKRIKEMSGGRIEITLYPPAALVPTFELLDGVGRRVVEMGYGAQLYWKGFFPFTEWTWGIPFAFDVVDHYDYLWWEAGLTSLVREAFATKNVFFIAPIYSDEWGSTICRKPIRTLKDFKGLKIRSGGIGAEIWKAYGAGIARLPGEELYTGISTGVIDGANWGSPYGNIATKLHEVAKHYTLPSLIQYDMEDMFINMDAWKSLPKDLQESFILATRVFALERQQRHAAGDDDAGQGVLRRDRHHHRGQALVARGHAHHAAPRRQRPDQAPQDNRRVVAIGQAVHHASRALRAAIARIGHIARKWDRAQALELFGRRLHEQAHFPVAGVITQRNRRAIRRAQAAHGAEDQKLVVTQLVRIPAHARVLREAEHVAAWRKAKIVFIERQTPRRASGVRLYLKNIIFHLSPRPRTTDESQRPPMGGPPSAVRGLWSGVNHSQRLSQAKAAACISKSNLCGPG